MTKFLLPNAVLGSRSALTPGIASAPPPPPPPPPTSPGFIFTEASNSQYLGVL